MNSLLNKSFSESQALSYKTSLTHLFQFWKMSKISVLTFPMGDIRKWPLTPLWSTSQFVRIHFLSSVVICLYVYVIKPLVPKKSKETLAGSRTMCMCVRCLHVCRCLCGYSVGYLCAMSVLSVMVGFCFISLIVINCFNCLI